MVYYVTREPRLFESSSNIEIVSAEKALSLLEPLSIVSLDTETQGLDPHTKRILLLQLGCKEFQVVIDTSTIDINVFKPFLESDREFIIHNALFDLQFMYTAGIIVKKVFDTYIAECLLWHGYPKKLSAEDYRRYEGNRYDETTTKSGKPSYILYTNLKKCGKLYCNVELDKSIRGKIINASVISDEIILYGADDVKYLGEIREKQLKALEEKGLLTAIEVENRFVRVLAYMEWCGIGLDVERWKEKMKSDLEELDKAKRECDKWLVENMPDSKYVYIERQGDLFAENPFDLTPRVSLNWSSSKQVAPIFEKFGVNLKVRDKENGGLKDSTEKKVLAPQKSKCSLIEPFLNYKAWSKTVSTYGQNFIDAINPVTGRVHTDYHQLGAATTRISSGGEDSINLLNIPREGNTRACFKCEKGNRWISIDYSGQESYLMGSIANDKAILNELINGDKDLHTLTAKIVFPQIPNNMTTSDVKHKFKEERQQAKGYEFAFNYGGNAQTIMDNFGLSKERATEIYSSYMSGFDGLKKYQDFRRKDWLNKGYILISPVTGHKVFIWDYPYIKKLKDLMTPEFWDNYRTIPRGANGKKSPRTIDEEVMTTRVSSFYSLASDHDRESINYPIQGAGSMCTRFALINFFTYICVNNLFGKVLISVAPYDEINCEAPEDIAEEVAARLHTDMVDAGKIFCTRCLLEAEISREDDGTLPTHWVH